MKAKIKATGEIKELSLAVFSGTQVVSYRDSNGVYYNTHEVEIIPDQPEVPIIDWEQRRYEIAKEAMSGFIRAIFGGEDGVAAISLKDSACKHVAKMTIDVADELINHLKNTPMK